MANLGISLNFPYVPNSWVDSDGVRETIHVVTNQFYLPRSSGFNSNTHCEMMEAVTKYKLERGASFQFLFMHLITMVAGSILFGLMLGAFSSSAAEAQEVQTAHLLFPQTRDLN